MRRSVVVAGAVLVLLAGGCGGGDDDPSAADASSTTAADGSTPTTSGGAGGDDPSTTEDGDAGCEAEASAVAAEEATGAFPDNPDVEWTVAGSSGEGGLTLVEVVPTPDEVGYPAFRLAFDCRDGEPVRIGTYALDEGAWILLATTDALGGGELPPELP